MFDGRCCKLCLRPARFYGLRNPENGFIGWCLVCQLHYRQNGQDWILRCLRKPSKFAGRAHAAFFNENIRKVIVITLVGSLASVEKEAQRLLWTEILYRGGPTDSENDSDSEYDEYRPYVNPMWKLAWKPRELVLNFLGDYQKQRRRV